MGGLWSENHCLLSNIQGCPLCSPPAMIKIIIIMSQICRSVTKLCPTLCDPLDCNTPGFPVLHYLSEFAQTHVHWVGDAIQPSHPLLPFLLLPSVFPSIKVFTTSWLFASGGQSTGASASVLPMNIQGWFPFGLIGLISLLSKVLSSSTTVRKHQFFSAQPSLWSSSHIRIWEKP